MSNHLRTKRAELLTEARQIIDNADAEKRSTTADENQKYDRIMSDIDGIDADIVRSDKLADAEKRSKEFVNAPITREDSQKGSESRNSRGSAEYREKFQEFLRGNNDGRELRALSKGTNSEGGYIVVAEQFEKDLIKAIADQTFLFNESKKVILSGAKQVTFPKVSAKLAAASWVTEITQASADATLAFGQLAIAEAPLSAYIKVSNTLLRDAAIDAEAEVREQFAEQIGYAVENAMLTGDGSSNKPVGIFDTTHADKIPTTQDVAFTSATALDTDAFVNAFYHIKAAYRAKAKWLLNRAVIKAARKLKDSEGRYIWEDGLKVGEVSTLLGHGVMESELAPGTMTAGLYVGAFADFSQYITVMVMPFEIQPLRELLALTNQTGFVGRTEVGGKPRIAEAFARLKMAAS